MDAAREAEQAAMESTGQEAKKGKQRTDKQEIAVRTHMDKIAAIVSVTIGEWQELAQAKEDAMQPHDRWAKRKSHETDEVVQQTTKRQRAERAQKMSATARKASVVPKKVDQRKRKLALTPQWS